MIDQLTIDRIKDAAKIEEVVGDYLTLHRRGANLIGLCPFHNEKTPSFNVNPARNIYHCFGCGEGGDPIKFVMKADQCTYVEALKKIAGKYGIEVRERELSDEERARQDDRESLWAVNEFAAKWFEDQLWNTDEGRSVAQSYFMQKRGLQEAMVRRFRLGYSPDSWDAFTKAALAAGYKEKFLIDSGLSVNTQRGTLVDRFRGRVIYPDRSVSGRVVAFGGRIMTQNKNVGKYVNSPESAIYVKSNELYGIFEARQAIARQGVCYLVEGYMDVISMHQAGVENVVASSGTSLTEQQIRLLHRFANNVVVLYDGDAAGIHASMRGIDMLLAEGLNIKVILLPDGHDPDSYSHLLGPDAFKQHLSENATDFIYFKASQLLAGAAGDAQARANAINDVMQSVALIPDVVTRKVYLQDCSRQFGIDAGTLEQKLNQLIVQQQDREAQQRNRENYVRPAYQGGTYQGSTYRPAARQYPPRPAAVSQQPAEQRDPFDLKILELLRLLVRYGERPFCTDGDTDRVVNVGEYIMADLDVDGINPRTPLQQTMFDLYREHMGDEGFVASEFFLNSDTEQVRTMAQSLLRTKYKESRIFSRQVISENVETEVKNLTEEDRLLEIVPKTLHELKLIVVEQQESEVQRQIEELASGSLEELLPLMRKKDRLNKIKLQLKEVIGRV